MNCTKIKRIIDEADRPDVFPLEAASHVAGCPECQSFADGRAKLRELTGSVARVTAPGNFNALLNERLSRVKSQNSWLSPAGFARMGAATAGLLVAFIALQYGGFLSKQGPIERSDQPKIADASPGEESRGTETNLLLPVNPPHAVPKSAAPSGRDHYGGAAIVRTASRITSASASRTPKLEHQDGSDLLVRDRNGSDYRMPMIQYSLGMQLQVVNASYGGRPQSRTSDSY